MQLRAPAKINLHLEILGRRSDGFHELETVFQTLDLADFLEVNVRPGASAIDLTCSDPTVPADATNLAWRAAAEVLRRRPHAGRVTIRLIKNIPHGAGLGGGSSDAASVLLSMNAQLAEPLPACELAEIGLDLGSDVPFFLLGGTAHATGRGEILTALPDLPPTPVTVLIPPVVLPTPTVFKMVTDAERGPRSLRGSTWAATTPPADLLHNRLTEAAIRACPAVGDLLAWLATQQVPYLMSGSGAACFALGDLADRQLPPGIRAWVTSTTPRTSMTKLLDT